MAIVCTRVWIHQHHTPSVRKVPALLRKGRVESLHKQKTDIAATDDCIRVEREYLLPESTMFVIKFELEVSAAF
jgi:hypothetical protein